MHTLKDALVAGPDALVVKLAGFGGRCKVARFYGTDKPWVPVHANVWMDQAWRRGGGPYDHSRAPARSESSPSRA